MRLDQILSEVMLLICVKKQMGAAMAYYILCFWSRVFQHQDISRFPTLIDNKLGMISNDQILTSFLLYWPCTKLPPTAVTACENKNTVVTSLLSTFYVLKVEIWRSKFKQFNHGQNFDHIGPIFSPKMNLTTQIGLWSKKLVENGGLMY